jgi:hypothetical protein
MFNLEGAYSGVGGGEMDIANATQSLIVHANGQCPNRSASKGRRSNGNGWN